MAWYKRHINEFLKSGFTNKGRAAGTGIEEEDYSESSFPGDPPWDDRRSRWQQSPMKIPEPSEVKTYKLSKEELERYEREGGSQK